MNKHLTSYQYSILQYLFDEEELEIYSRHEIRSYRAQYKSLEGSRLLSYLARIYI